MDSESSGSTWAGKDDPRVHPLLDVAYSLRLLVTVVCLLALLTGEARGVLEHSGMTDSREAVRWIRRGMTWFVGLQIVVAIVYFATRVRRGPSARDDMGVLADGDGPIRRELPRVLVLLTFVDRAWWWAIPCGVLGLFASESVLVFSVLILPTIWLLFATYQLHGAGPLTVRFTGRPYRPGGRVTLTVGGQAAALLDDMTLTLRCRIVRGLGWHWLREGASAIGERLQGAELGPVLRSARSLESRAEEDSEVEVRFDIPAKAPPTRVGAGLYQVGWDVEIRGRTLGVPYVARCPLWVCDPGEA